MVKIGIDTNYIRILSLAYSDNKRTKKGSLSNSTVAEVNKPFHSFPGENYTKICSTEK